MEYDMAAMTLIGTINLQSASAAQCNRSLNKSRVITPTEHLPNEHEVQFLSSELTPHLAIVSSPETQTLPWAAVPPHPLLLADSRSVPCSVK